MRSSPLLVRLLATASLLGVNSALAQERGASGTEVESVVVTGTLITRPGYTAPTPVTSITAADFQTSAPVQVADVLNQMPQFGAASTNPVGGNKGVSGISAVNLRNLGPTRTLVLLDGQRLPAYGTSNAVDIDSVPQNIIRRVDVVTGGASAAYGSDAVAGVVNMVLDTEYEGVKANIQYGNTQNGIYETYKGDLAAGTSFDGGKGHILLSLAYSDSPNQVVDRDERWYRDRGGEVVFVPNPAQPAGFTPNPFAPAGNGQPQLIRQGFVGINAASEGGLISSGPLRGTQFVGPNGTPAPFNFGTSIKQFSYGGSGTAGFGPQFTTTASDMHVLAQSNFYFNSFLYASYQLPLGIKAHASLDYNASGGYSDDYPPAVRNNSINVSINNPFLPAQTVAAMKAAGVTSFLMGSTFGNLGELDRGFDSVLNSGDKKQTRFEVGFDGTIGNNWTWSSYYTHGEVHDTQNWLYDPYLPYLNNAINAVVAPAGNSAGLAAGTTVCASTLINPTDGCVPLNLFGVHVASPEAVRYIDPPEWQRIVDKQDAAQISIQGSPFSDWAGDVSFAGGADYRSESSTSTSNALAYTHLYGSGNASAFHGAVSVWEGYAETVVPLAKNEWWSEQLDFNAAGRLTSYSNSGLVETWKLGATDQVTDEFRLRATWSYDIRAPNLAELYTAQTSGSNSIFDPFTNTQPNVRQVTSGNRNLTPETATTFSGGVTYLPNWLPGFSASVDWYSINIKNAIGSTPNALTYCFLGFTVYCPLVTRNSAGVVTEVDSYPVNTAVASVSGLDMEFSYTTDLLGGNLSLHGVASYTDENTTTLNGVTLNNAGSLGSDTLGRGLPKLKSLISATYGYDRFSGTIQTRIWGSARYNALYDPSYLGDNNNIAPVAYLDIRGSYDLGSEKEYQMYFAVDNLLDHDPPSIPPLYTGQPFTAPTLTTTYDTLGRVGRFGIRVNF
jgi:iron complex outermembrane receptor protein